MGRVLGIDYGDSRIGLAMSDPIKIIASPFKTIRNEGNEKCLQVFQSLIKEKDVEAIVVGLPIGLKGQETAQTKKVGEFVNLLYALKLPIHLEDERLSSVSAEKSMIQQNIKTGHNKGLIDQRAAAIILQQFLDKQNR
ncbi:MAG: Holliday junction resolvase RuvX [Candidatus Marinimicrobia bacterium]|mgnify:FL=1|jgi:putative holliday junction resolvase|nr:Holliday junction resolvase RuvX [Candidatus Neomarinimicrobiota bacterium]MBT3849629.1 Holliday junction resolvase RuvX [Candidatus Neomarinimicrobiota bacterium]MBT4053730.1 Holliday junction resolvase RuvX [Candidatus Neomarinimicrobiota bacterium]MBT4370917.1 Holliday junction resolvase RuvX [Candidatus Neomarinimicrobiota bacterium]MBT4828865.1 Holliday junction resolvase RuvX [Candidatus Neomarinimicrobiota bacterium]